MADPMAPPFRILAVTCLLVVASPACSAEPPDTSPALPSAPVYSGCAAPPTVFRRVLVVDPARSQGDGSARAPFPRLDQALAQARAGDLVLLRSGDYGKVSISGVNTGFITVAAAAGQEPVLKGLRVESNASYWRLSGLRIVGAPDPVMDGGWPVHPPLVRFFGGDNIVFDRNTVATTLDDFPWEAWEQGRQPSRFLSNGVMTESGVCVSLAGNTLRNLFDGIAAGGDQSTGRGRSILIEGNQIDGFAGDGIDIYGSQMLLRRNTIQNSHDLCQDICIHTDGIQGWAYHNLPGRTNVNVEIDANTIIQQTIPKMALPADDLHGITIFSGDWDGVRVANNVVVTPAWHGLSLYGAHNATVVNNTVLSPSRDRSAWILITSGKPDDPTPLNVVVRNNITSALNIGQPREPTKGVTADHNLVTDDPKSLFVAFDPAHARYDLHLAPNSKALHRGLRTAAPSSDIEGRARGDDADVGAYAGENSGDKGGAAAR